MQPNHPKKSNSKKASKNPNIPSKLYIRLNSPSSSIMSKPSLDTPNKSPVSNDYTPISFASAQTIKTSNFLRTNSPQKDYASKTTTNFKSPSDTPKKIYTGVHHLQKPSNNPSRNATPSKPRPTNSNGSQTSAHKVSISPTKDNRRLKTSPNEKTTSLQSSPGTIRYQSRRGDRGYKDKNGEVVLTFGDESAKSGETTNLGFETRIKKLSPSRVVVKKVQKTGQDWRENQKDNISYVIKQTIPLIPLDHEESEFREVVARSKIHTANESLNNSADRPHLPHETYVTKYRLGSKHAEESKRETSGGKSMKKVPSLFTVSNYHSGGHGDSSKKTYTKLAHSKSLGTSMILDREHERVSTMNYNSEPRNFEGYIRDMAPFIKNRPEYSDSITTPTRRLNQVQIIKEAIAGPKYVEIRISRQSPKKKQDNEEQVQREKSGERHAKTDRSVSEEAEATHMKIRDLYKSADYSKDLTKGRFQAKNLRDFSNVEAERKFSFGVQDKSNKQSSRSIPEMSSKANQEVVEVLEQAPGDVHEEEKIRAIKKYLQRKIRGFPESTERVDDQTPGNQMNESWNLQHFSDEEDDNHQSLPSNNCSFHVDEIENPISEPESLIYRKSQGTSRSRIQEKTIEFVDEHDHPEEEEKKSVDNAGQKKAQPFELHLPKALEGVSRFDEKQETVEDDGYEEDEEEEVVEFTTQLEDQEVDERTAEILKQFPSGGQQQWDQKNSPEYYHVEPLDLPLNTVKRLSVIKEFSDEDFGTGREDGSEKKLNVTAEGGNDSSERSDEFVTGESDQYKEDREKQTSQQSARKKYSTDEEKRPEISRQEKDTVQEEEKTVDTKGEKEIPQVVKQPEEQQKKQRPQKGNIREFGDQKEIISQKESHSVKRAILRDDENESPVKREVEVVETIINEQSQEVKVSESGVTEVIEKNEQNEDKKVEKVARERGEQQQTNEQKSEIQILTSVDAAFGSQEGKSELIKREEGKTEDFQREEQFPELSNKFESQIQKPDVQRNIKNEVKAVKQESIHAVSKENKIAKEESGIQKQKDLAKETDVIQSEQAEEGELKIQKSLQEVQVSQTEETVLTQGEKDEKSISLEASNVKESKVHRIQSERKETEKERVNVSGSPIRENLHFNDKVRNDLEEMTSQIQEENLEIEKVDQSKLKEKLLEQEIEIQNQNIQKDQVLSVDHKTEEGKKELTEKTEVLNVIEESKSFEKTEREAGEIEFQREPVQVQTAKRSFAKFVPENKDLSIVGEENKETPQEKQNDSSEIQFIHEKKDLNISAPEEPVTEKVISHEVERGVELDIQTRGQTEETVKRRVQKLPEITKDVLELQEEKLSPLKTVQVLNEPLRNESVSLKQENQVENLDNIGLQNRSDFRDDLQSVHAEKKNADRKSLQTIVHQQTEIITGIKVQENRENEEIKQEDNTSEKYQALIQKDEKPTSSETEIVNEPKEEDNESPKMSRSQMRKANKKKKTQGLFDQSQGSKQEDAANKVDDVSPKKYNEKEPAQVPQIKEEKEIKKIETKDQKVVEGQKLTSVNQEQEKKFMKEIEQKVYEQTIAHDVVEKVEEDARLNTAKTGESLENETPTNLMEKSDVPEKIQESIQPQKEKDVNVVDSKRLLEKEKAFPPVFEKTIETSSQREVHEEQKEVVFAEPKSGERSTPLEENVPEENQAIAPRPMEKEEAKAIEQDFSGETQTRRNKKNKNKNQRSKDSELIEESQVETIANKNDTAEEKQEEQSQSVSQGEANIVVSETGSQHEKPVSKETEIIDVSKEENESPKMSRSQMRKANKNKKNQGLFGQSEESKEGNGANKIDEISSKKENKEESVQVSQIKQEKETQKGDTKEKKDAQDQKLISVSQTQENSDMKELEKKISEQIIIPVVREKVEDKVRLNAAKESGSLNQASTNLMEELGMKDKIEEQVQPQKEKNVEVVDSQKLLEKEKVKIPVFEKTTETSSQREVYEEQKEVTLFESKSGDRSIPLEENKAIALSPQEKEEKTKAVEQGFIGETQTQTQTRRPQKNKKSQHSKVSEAQSIEESQIKTLALKNEIAEEQQEESQGVSQREVDIVVSEIISRDEKPVSKETEIINEPKEDDNESPKMSRSQMRKANKKKKTQGLFGQSEETKEDHASHKTDEISPKKDNKEESAQVSQIKEQKEMKKGETNKPEDQKLISFSQEPEAKFTKDADNKISEQIITQAILEKSEVEEKEGKTLENQTPAKIMENSDVQEKIKEPVQPQKVSDRKGTDSQKFFEKEKPRIPVSEKIIETSSQREVHEEQKEVAFAESKSVDRATLVEENLLDKNITIVPRSKEEEEETKAVEQDFTGETQTQSRKNKKNKKKNQHSKDSEVQPIQESSVEIIENKKSIEEKQEGQSHEVSQGEVNITVSEISTQHEKLAKAVPEFSEEQKETVEVLRQTIQAENERSKGFVEQNTSQVQKIEETTGRKEEQEVTLKDSQDEKVNEVEVALNKPVDEERKESQSDVTLSLAEKEEQEGDAGKSPENKRKKKNKRKGKGSNKHIEEVQNDIQKETFDTIETEKKVEGVDQQQERQETIKEHSSNDMIEKIEEEKIHESVSLLTREAISEFDKRSQIGEHIQESQKKKHATVALISNNENEIQQEKEKAIETPVEERNFEDQDTIPEEIKEDESKAEAQKVDAGAVQEEKESIQEQDKTGEKQGSFKRKKGKNKKKTIQSLEEAEQPKEVFEETKQETKVFGSDRGNESERIKRSVVLPSETEEDPVISEPQIEEKAPQETSETIITEKVVGRKETEQKESAKIEKEIRETESVVDRLGNHEEKSVQIEKPLPTKTEDNVISENVENTVGSVEEKQDSKEDNLKQEVEEAKREDEVVEEARDETPKGLSGQESKNSKNKKKNKKRNSKAPFEHGREENALETQAIDHRDEKESEQVNKETQEEQKGLVDESEEAKRQENLRSSAISSVTESREQISKDEGEKRNLEMRLEKTSHEEKDSVLGGVEQEKTLPIVENENRSDVEVQKEVKSPIEETDQVKNQVESFSENSSQRKVQEEVQRGKKSSKNKKSQNVKKTGESEVEARKEVEEVKEQEKESVEKSNIQRFEESKVEQKEVPTAEIQESVHLQDQNLTAESQEKKKQKGKVDLIDQNQGSNVIIERENQQINESSIQTDKISEVTIPTEEEAVEKDETQDKNKESTPSRKKKKNQKKKTQNYSEVQQIQAPKEEEKVTPEIHTEVISHSIQSEVENVKKAAAFVKTQDEPQHLGTKVSKGEEQSPLVESMTKGSDLLSSNNQPEEVHQTPVSVYTQIIENIPSRKESFGKSPASKPQSYKDIEEVKQNQNVENVTINFEVPDNRTDESFFSNRSHTPLGGEWTPLARFEGIYQHQEDDVNERGGIIRCCSRRYRKKKAVTPMSGQEGILTASLSSVDSKDTDKEEKKEEKGGSLGRILKRLLSRKTIETPPPERSETVEDQEKKTEIIKAKVQEKIEQSPKKGSEFRTTDVGDLNKEKTPVSQSLKDKLSTFLWKGKARDQEEPISEQTIPTQQEKAEEKSFASQQEESKVENEGLQKTDIQENKGFTQSKELNIIREVELEKEENSPEKPKMQFETQEATTREKEEIETSERTSQAQETSPKRSKKNKKKRQPALAKDENDVVREIHPEISQSEKQIEQMEEAIEMPKQDSVLVHTHVDAGSSLKTENVERKENNTGLIEKEEEISQNNNLTQEFVERPNNESSSTLEERLEVKTIVERKETQRKDNTKKSSNLLGENRQMLHDEVVREEVVSKSKEGEIQELEYNRPVQEEQKKSKARKNYIPEQTEEESKVGFEQSQSKESLFVDRADNRDEVGIASDDLSKKQIDIDIEKVETQEKIDEPLIQEKKDDGSPKKTSKKNKKRKNGKQNKQESESPIHKDVSQEERPELGEELNIPKSEQQKNAEINEVQEAVNEEPQVNVKEDPRQNIAPIKEHDQTEIKEIEVHTDIGETEVKQRFEENLQTGDELTKEEKAITLEGRTEVWKEENVQEIEYTRQPQEEKKKSKVVNLRVQEEESKIEDEKSANPETLVVGKTVKIDEIATNEAMIPVAEEKKQIEIPDEKEEIKENIAQDDKKDEASPSKKSRKNKKKKQGVQRQQEDMIPTNKDTSPVEDAQEIKETVSDILEVEQKTEQKPDWKEIDSTESQIDSGKTLQVPTERDLEVIEEKSERQEELPKEKIKKTLVNSEESKVEVDGQKQDLGTVKEKYPVDAVGSAHKIEDTEVSSNKNFDIGKIETEEDTEKGLDEDSKKEDASPKKKSKRNQKKKRGSQNDQSPFNQNTHQEKDDQVQQQELESQKSSLEVGQLIETQGQNREEPAKEISQNYEISFSQKEQEGVRTTSGDQLEVLENVQVIEVTSQVQEKQKKSTRPLHHLVEEEESKKEIDQTQSEEVLLDKESIIISTQEPEVFKKVEINLEKEKVKGESSKEPPIAGHEAEEHDVSPKKKSKKNKKKRGSQAKYDDQTPTHHDASQELPSPIHHQDTESQKSSAVEIEQIKPVTNEEEQKSYGVSAGVNEIRDEIVDKKVFEEESKKEIETTQIRDNLTLEVQEKSKAQDIKDFHQAERSLEEIKETEESPKEQADDQVTSPSKKSKRNRKKKQGNQTKTPTNQLASQEKITLDNQEETENQKHIAQSELIQAVADTKDELRKENKETGEQTKNEQNKVVSEEKLDPLSKEKEYFVTESDENWRTVTKREINIKEDTRVIKDTPQAQEEQKPSKVELSHPGEEESKKEIESHESKDLQTTQIPLDNLKETEESPEGQVDTQQTDEQVTSPSKKSKRNRKKKQGSPTKTPTHQQNSQDNSSLENQEKSGQVQSVADVKEVYKSNIEEQIRSEQISAGETLDQLSREKETLGESYDNEGWRIIQKREVEKRESVRVIKDIPQIQKEQNVQQVKRSNFVAEEESKQEIQNIQIGETLLLTKPEGSLDQEAKDLQTAGISLEVLKETEEQLDIQQGEEQVTSPSKKSKRNRKKKQGNQTQTPTHQFTSQEKANLENLEETESSRFVPQSEKIQVVEEKIDQLSKDRESFVADSNENWRTVTKREINTKEDVRVILDIPQVQEEQNKSTVKLSYPSEEESKREIESHESKDLHTTIIPLDNLKETEESQKEQIDTQQADEQVTSPSKKSKRNRKKKQGNQTQTQTPTHQLTSQEKVSLENQEETESPKSVTHAEQIQSVVDPKDEAHKENKEVGEQTRNEQNKAESSEDRFDQLSKEKEAFTDDIDNEGWRLVQKREIEKREDIGIIEDIQQIQEEQKKEKVTQTHLVTEESKKENENAQARKETEEKQTTQINLGDIKETEHSPKEQTGVQQIGKKKGKQTKQEDESPSHHLEEESHEEQRNLNSLSSDQNKLLVEEIEKVTITTSQSNEIIGKEISVGETSTVTLRQSEIEFASRQEKEDVSAVEFIRQTQKEKKKANVNFRVQEEEAKLEEKIIEKIDIHREQAEVSSQTTEEPFKNQIEIPEAKEEIVDETPVQADFSDHEASPTKKSRKNKSKKKKQGAQSQQDQDKESISQIEKAEIPNFPVKEEQEVIENGLVKQEEEIKQSQNITDFISTKSENVDAWVEVKNKSSEKKRDWIDIEDSKKSSIDKQLRKEDLETKKSSWVELRQEDEQPLAASVEQDTEKQFREQAPVVPGDQRDIQEKNSEVDPVNLRDNEEEKVEDLEVKEVDTPKGMYEATPTGSKKKKRNHKKKRGTQSPIKAADENKIIGKEEKDPQVENLNDFTKATQLIDDQKTQEISSNVRQEVFSGTNEEKTEEHSAVAEESKEENKNEAVQVYSTRFGDVPRKIIQNREKDNEIVFEKRHSQEIQKVKKRALPVDESNEQIIGGQEQILEVVLNLETSEQEVKKKQGHISQEDQTEEKSAKEQQLEETKEDKEDQEKEEVLTTEENEKGTQQTKTQRKKNRKSRNKAQGVMEKTEEVLDDAINQIDLAQEETAQQTLEKNISEEAISSHIVSKEMTELSGEIVRDLGFAKEIVKRSVLPESGGEVLEKINVQEKAEVLKEATIGEEKDLKGKEESPRTEVEEQKSFDIHSEERKEEIHEDKTEKSQDGKSQPEEDHLKVTETVKQETQEQKESEILHEAEVEKISVPRQTDETRKTSAKTEGDEVENLQNSEGKKISTKVEEEKKSLDIVQPEKTIDDSQNTESKLIKETQEEKQIQVIQNIKQIENVKEVVESEKVISSIQQQIEPRENLQESQKERVAEESGIQQVIVSQGEVKMDVLEAKEEIDQTIKEEQKQESQEISNPIESKKVVEAETIEEIKSKKEILVVKEIKSESQSDLPVKSTENTSTIVNEQTDVKSEGMQNASESSQNVKVEETEKVREVKKTENVEISQPKEEEKKILSPETQKTVQTEVVISQEEKPKTIVESAQVGFQSQEEAKVSSNLKVEKSSETISKVETFVTEKTEQQKNVVFEEKKEEKVVPNDVTAQKPNDEKSTLSIIKIQEVGVSEDTSPNQNRQSPSESSKNNTNELKPPAGKQNESPRRIFDDSRSLKIVKEEAQSDEDSDKSKHDEIVIQNPQNNDVEQLKQVPTLRLEDAEGSESYDGSHSENLCEFVRSELIIKGFRSAGTHDVAQEFEDTRRNKDLERTLDLDMTTKTDGVNLGFQDLQEKFLDDLSNISQANTLSESNNFSFQDHYDEEVKESYRSPSRGSRGMSNRSGKDMELSRNYIEDNDGKTSRSNAYKSPDEQDWKNISFSDSLIIRPSATMSPHKGIREEVHYDIPIMVEENFARVETLQKMDNNQGAIKLLKEISDELDNQKVESFPAEDISAINSYKIHTRNRLGLELYKKGDYQDALEQSKKVLTMDKTNIQALYKGYQAHMKLGNTEKAKAALKAVKRLMGSPSVMGYNQKFLLDNLSIPSMSGSHNSFSEDLQSSRLMSNFSNLSFGGSMS